MTVVPSPLPVFEHRLVAYRRVWRGTVLNTFLAPVLILLGLGISVGSYVNQGGALGVPYLDYIAPGLLASTAVQVALGESSWPVMSFFQWIRVYHAMRASPLRPQDMVGGETLYILLRVGTSSLAFLVVATAFGAVHSWRGMLALPAAMLAGAAVTGPMMAYSASITSDNMFALIFRFLVIPMTLFAGVFFPVSVMPTAARWAAYVSPLWHGVELCRAATLGWPTTLPPMVHIGYLAVWGVAGFALARARYAKRLSD
jgi:lipooligosaccharide transport system permease protein